MSERQETQHLIKRIRNILLKRAFNLNKIHASNDSSERQHHMAEFAKQSAQFDNAQIRLDNVVSNGKAQWKKIKQEVLQDYILQNQIIAVLRKPKLQAVDIEFLSKLNNEHNSQMAKLVQLYDLDSDLTVSRLNIAKENNITTQNILGIFGFLTIFVGIIVTRSTVIAVKRIEGDMSSQGTRLRELYKISALPVSIDEQIYEMLKLEAQVLDMEIGKVCKIDPVENSNTFVHVYSIPELNIPQGRIAQLQQTFCSITYTRDEPLAINHVAESEFKEYMCYSASEQESYIAHQVFVNGELYGTISFSSRHPRKTPFSSIDKELIRLMANWVSLALERQFAEEEMARATQMAEQANVAKSNFLANMSHEIRTPLTAIIGFAESLKTGDYSDEQRAQWTSSIVRNGTHLHQIINDILDLSKIEAGQLEVEKTDISPSNILKEIDSIVGSATRDKGLTFNIEYELPYPKTILSDPTRLKQILINLCSNALKFTNKGGITINTRCDSVAHQIIFKVTDTGIGLTDDQAEKIFRPFSQADSSTTRKYGGTGLGLTISTQLAEKLGGSLSCKSALGEGSSFIVTINTGPLSIIEFSETLPDLMENIVSERNVEEYKILSGRILLAEDNIDNQALIAMYVKKFGLQIDIANNGQEAVEQAVQEDYDLILMDMQMPVMGGIEAIELLRQLGNTLPIIALTANATTSDKDRCIKAGADDYATKPINIDKFYITLANYLPENTSDSQVTEIDNFEEINKLTDKFMMKLPSMIEELGDAVNHLQWDSVQSLSHILKGMGGSFGQPEITRISAIINKDAIKKNFDDIPSEMSDLKSICDSAISEFKNKKSANE